jgi:HAE1 family hydrophobic/amphiphilic exporter-1
MLVDNAVVVLESIYRHRERGMSRLRAALQGSRQVLPAVIASTATSVIVFLPLVLGGKTEVTTWIGEVGRTIIFTLACSLFISVTAIPLAMGRLLPERATTPGHAFVALTRRHRRVLEWTLAHRPLALGIAFVVVITAVIPFALKVDKSAFSGTQVKAVNVNYEFTDNLNYREVEKYVRTGSSRTSRRST